jgi:hypothetical protein
MRALYRVASTTSSPARNRAAPDTAPLTAPLAFEITDGQPDDLEGSLSNRMIPPIMLTKPERSPARE